MSSSANGLKYVILLFIISYTCFRLNVFFKRF